LDTPRTAQGALRPLKRTPTPIATDDDIAAGTVERLSRAAGFDPVKAGGVDAALRIEMPGGDLHQMGLNGELLDLDRAREVLATTEGTA
jgi:8-hydroxy-5-deazaflavin:NADPH oxidoreductase